MSSTPRKRPAASAPQSQQHKSKVAAASERKGSFEAALDPSSPPHTLILGTQPGDVSLEANRYYDFHTNAMWHIVGDALGWTRGWKDARGRGPTKSITRSTLHTRECASYDEALRSLTARGYALWDVLSESDRAGSLDGAIDKRTAKAADVRGLLQLHPTISTICLASGGTTAKFFKAHFKDWLKEEGAFSVAADSQSQKEFGKLVPGGGAITLVVMESVSPAYVPRVAHGANPADSEAFHKRREAYADAGYPQLSRRASAYAWKRQQWFDACFQRELSADAAALRFGERTGDFVDDT